MHIGMLASLHVAIVYVLSILKWHGTHFDLYPIQKWKDIVRYASVYNIYTQYCTTLQNMDWSDRLRCKCCLFIMTFPLLLICRCWKQCYYGGKTWCYTAQKWHYLGGVKCDASPNKTPEDKGEFCDTYGKVCITACYVGWKSDMNTMSEDRYFVSLIASFPPRPCDRLLSFKTNRF